MTHPPRMHYRRRLTGHSLSDGEAAAVEVLVVAVAVVAAEVVVVGRSRAVVVHIEHFEQLVAIILLSI